MLEQIPCQPPLQWLSGYVARASSDQAGAEGAPPLRILIVEDEALFALHLEDQLKDLGHAPVGMVATQEAAISEAILMRPDLILMDIRLAHGGSGIVAAREILSRMNIPSIFITAHSDAATRTRAKDAGALAFLVKPIDPAELSTALRNAAMLLRR